MDETHPIPCRPPDPEPLQRLDCGRGNCKILNPVNPGIWCRACLLRDVDRYRERDRARAQHERLEFDY